MAKQIIILQSSPSASAGLMALHYLLWLSVAVPLPNPNAVSQYSGISAEDNLSLQKGTLVEESYNIQLPINLSDGQIKDITSAHWVARQTYLNTMKGPGNLYNVSYDTNSGWSA